MDLTDKLAAERRARLAAERKLDLKCRELFEANRKLSQHALSLSGQVIEKRDEAERLKEQSARVRADLQRAEAHAETVERRLWDSVETITDGFAVFDAEDRLIAANTAWLSIFRFSSRIGPGTLYLEVLRCAVEEEHVALGDEPQGDWMARMLERWDSPPPLEPVTIRTVTGAWYRLVDRRSRDGDMVCIAQDVTALKEREAELDEARHRAEAANRAKSAFLANMSHELRTPMNGVVGMADMLLESDLDEEAQVYVSTIKSSGEALLQIINHVLDFSKMEAERLVLRPEPFDLERLLHEVVTLLSPRARDKALGLHVDYDLFLPTRLTGDSMRIRQILINLVGNAVKFTESGHVVIRVVGFESVVDDADEAGPRPWRLHVTVEDTGIGIPEDMREHIFGSFAQVESETNRAFEGTGLGLAITRQLVELMGGEIWVESEEGCGSCFGFSLTVPAAEPERRALPRLEPHLCRVLIVASPGLDADIMARQFAQLGLDVVRATTGSEALALAGEPPHPQIVAIDETLPDTDGRTLAAALAQSGPPAARLLVSATPHEAQRAAGDLSGAEPGPSAVHAVLARPVLRAQLFHVLTHLPALDAPADAVAASESTAPARGPAPGRGADRPAAGAAAAGAPVAAGSAEVGAAAGGRASGSKSGARPEAGPGAGAPGPQGEAAAAGPSPAVETAQGGPRPMRVLAAEDNKTNRFVFAKMLQQLEIELAFAEDGHAAVEQAAAFAPDLLFMDISMPRMDGKQAARAIRAGEAEAGDGRRVPIVAMTAHALAGDREGILAAGIDGYLTKPLKRAELVAEILQHCPPGCLSPDGAARAAAG